MQLLIALTFGFLSAVLVIAGPAKHTGHRAPTDLDYLQFALTTEHLVSAFERQGLAKFSENSFNEAGFPPGSYDQVAELANQDQQHVSFLQQAITDRGATATNPCAYSFSFTTPRAFTGALGLLKDASLQVYIGIVPLLCDSDLITGSASILAVEGRHAAFVAGQLNGQSPWNAAFEPSLASLDLVYSLFSSYFDSCPPSNPPLPVNENLPRLTLEGTVVPGATVTVRVGNGIDVSNTNLVFYIGNGYFYTRIDEHSMAVIPSFKGSTNAYSHTTDSSSGRPSANSVKSGATSNTLSSEGKHQALLGVA